MGATGTVLKFIMSVNDKHRAKTYLTSADEAAKHNSPLPIVVVQFDTLKHGCDSYDDEIPNVIPIHPVKCSYGNLTRSQIPLQLSWGMTIHKAQGTTVDSIICCLDGIWKRDKLLYVAMSRVKTFHGLNFETGSGKDKDIITEEKLAKEKKSMPFIQEEYERLRDAPMQYALTIAEHCKDIDLLTQWIGTEVVSENDDIQDTLIHQGLTIIQPPEPTNQTKHHTTKCTPTYQKKKFVEKYSMQKSSAAQVQTETFSLDTGKERILQLFLAYSKQLFEHDDVTIIQSNTQTENLPWDTKWYIGLDDFKRITDEKWLDKNVINGSLQMFAAEFNKLSEVHILSNVYYETYIKNETNTQDHTSLLEKPIILPIHTPGHWILAIIEPWSDTLMLIDPFGPAHGRQHTTIVTKIQTWYCSLCISAGKEIVSCLNVKYDFGLPRQEDSFNCGIYVIFFAREYIRNKNLTCISFDNDIETLSEMRKFLAWKLVSSYKNFKVDQKLFLMFEIHSSSRIFNNGYDIHGLKYSCAFLSIHGLHTSRTQIAASYKDRTPQMLMKYLRTSIADCYNTIDLIPIKYLDEYIQRQHMQAEAHQNVLTKRQEMIQIITQESCTQHSDILGQLDHIFNEYNKNNHIKRSIQTYKEALEHEKNIPMFPIQDEEAIQLYIDMLSQDGYKLTDMDLYIISQIEQINIIRYAPMNPLELIMKFEGDSLYQKPAIFIWYEHEHYERCHMPTGNDMTPLLKTLPTFHPEGH